jgi:two-component system, chemotaxis family, protein-glutamate methylesterase/glutaminase
MAPIRVLVVDDSAVARRLVSEALCTDPSIEVAGTANNGRVALQKLQQFQQARAQVDAVTLDVEMPELDGIATLIEIRKFLPHLPVIMFSAITERGAAATLDAIARGANDYVLKPTSAESLGEARRRVADDLCPRVKAFAQAAQARLSPPPQQPSSSSPQAPLSAPPRPASHPVLSVPPPPAHALQHPFQTAPPPVVARPRPARIVRPEVLLIGVSTGGPNALAELIPALPADFPLPVLVTQHMPPVFTRLLADRLDGASNLEVRECQGDEKLKAGFVYIAKGDFHMKVKGSRTDVRLALDQAPPENSCRPAVDAMFRSAVELWGGAAIAVILTGMGQDGLKGCQLLRDAGGQVVVQDQATSVIWGMPGAVVRAGVADKVLPLKKIASELVTLTAATSGVPARRINP